ncbi:hypothetical protein RJ639_045532 [Escallonia herrerae]|uniref:Poly [ADP-ribose] polymerase n=1 Tax=Escallonia herrerae TaxID=1293975 RepID=A0AA89AZ11_9ASTE|nr:hypothetical protein RJ639_045532 [Escallonia herrerae]
MADHSKLKVAELRTELAQRGLSTSGTKTTLVGRLESAISEESKVSADFNGDSTTKKRPRECEDGGFNDYEKIKAVDKFRNMGVKQLREEANLRGISASGSKKELIDRLCADSEKQLGDIVDAKEDEDTDKRKKAKLDELQSMGVKQLREEATIRGTSARGSKKELLDRLIADLDRISNDSYCIWWMVAKEEEDEDANENKKQKLVTATKKGAAVLDQWLPDHIKSQYHVLQLGGDVYDAMLNQTHVGDNNNKFYVIQVLESDDGCTFMVYNRWGRVGVKGQDKLYGPYASAEAAIQEFEQKFYGKTKNQWSDRTEFVCHPKSYAWLEMDYTEKEEELAVNGESSCKMQIQPRETKLEARVAKFISLICNVSMMKQQMMEIGYNADKLPLGKLSKSTILKGYGVLKRIADVIDQADRIRLEQLSGYEIVEALGEIEVATKLLEDVAGMQEDPLYYQYQRLHCDLAPVDVDSKEFCMIATYTKNTHAKTHSNYAVDIVQIFRVSREGEVERFKKFSTTRNRVLLWHGSRLTNWTGILSQGNLLFLSLRIAPPEAPVTGYMFGKGVYFADMFSKSANYCCSTNTATAGVLLLCEVALGDMAELLTAKYDADQLPKGKLSTKGVGTTAPDFSKVETLEDGVVVPLGKPKEQKKGLKGSLLYNEYIVYNVDQIRMRYVVHVNFNYR